MNHTINESNERIIAIGNEGSHMRNKCEFNLTLPKLIQRINNSNAWSNIIDSNITNDLTNICQDGNIPLNKRNDLIKSAYFYSLDKCF